jgi:hypothetical protein
MVFSGLLRRVALVRTDDSEEPGASFIRVTKSVNQEQHMLQLATDVRCEEIFPEDTILHSHRRENLKSYTPCQALTNNEFAAEKDKTDYNCKVHKYLMRSCGARVVSAISTSPKKGPEAFVTDALKMENGPQANLP